MRNPVRYLEDNIEQPLGYQECHHLGSSLDASVCAMDCEMMKDETFARNCHKAGGLFKCCIRRDAAFCDECRYSNKKNLTHLVYLRQT